VTPLTRRVPVLLVLAWMVVYLPHLLSGDTLPVRDLGATQVPWRTVWRDEVTRGTLPLWDPLSNQGRPLLANPNAMAAYPGTLLFLLPQPERAVAWHVALHHLLLLLGCYALARRTGALRGAAGIAAATVATCGVAWSTTTFLNAQASLALAPWALLSAVALPDRPRQLVRKGVLGGLVLGLAFLAGEPITAAFAAVAWTAVALASRRRYAWLAVAACAAATFLVAAPVLVPLLAVYRETLRGSLGMASGALAADALAPRRWLELLFPNLLGAPLGNANSGFWAAASFPWQRYYPVVFVGSFPLLAVPFAWRRRRDLAAWWALAGVGLVGALATASSLASTLALTIPALTAVRFGIKFLVLVILALVPLVAAGYEEMMERWRAGGRRRTVAAVLCAAALAPLALGRGRLLRAALSVAYPASREALSAVPTASLQRSFAGDLLALLAPPAALLAAPSAPLATMVAVLASNTLSARDVVLWDRAARWRDPPAAMRLLGPSPVIASFTPTAKPPSPPPDEALGRFWAMRAALVPNYGSRWGAAYVLTRGPDGLEPVREELLAAASADLPSIEARAHVAAALGATAVVAARPLPGWTCEEADGVWVALAPDRGAPAYLASRLLPTEGPVATVAQLADAMFRPGQDAALEGGAGARVMTGGTVTERPDVPHHRRFEIDTRGEGVLVVRQSYMRCWKARVDGAPATVVPVNGAQLGVRVPAGRHLVEVYLDAKPYLVGLLAPLLLAPLLWFSRRAGS
jgi:fluoride ion exporter CrcB/FEX